MKKTKNLSVGKGYLTALALAVLFSAVQFGSDVGPRNLQTAVVPTGYVESIWVKIFLPSNTKTAQSSVTTITHSDAGDTLKVAYNVDDANLGALENSDCGVVSLYSATSAGSTSSPVNMTVVANSSSGTGCTATASLTNAGVPMKLALGEKGGTFTGMAGSASYTQLPSKTSPTTQWTATGTHVEGYVYSSYGQCDAGKYWDTSTSACITQPSCGNGWWDTSTNACKYSTCSTDTWAVGKPECGPTDTDYSKCRDPFYWYNKNSGIFEKCSRDTSVDANFCNNNAAHTQCEAAKTSRITLLEKAFAIDATVKSDWVKSSYPSLWWEPTWDSTQPYRKYDVATNSLVACSNNTTQTYTSGTYYATCQPVADKWKDWYLLKWQGDYADWKKWNSNTCNNDKICGSGETMSSCPADCGSLSCNYNKVCDSGETTTNCPSDCGSTTGEMTLRGTIFKGGQYVDPATYALRNCVSPNTWMKEEATASGARGFHCMPNYTATTSDYPPASCTGTLWAGSSFSTDYCATTKDPGTVVNTCDNDKVCESGETTSSCPNDCGSNWVPPADWKEIIWNDLGLKSYVSIKTPQSVIDAAKKACYTTKPGDVTWPNPSDFTKPDTVGVPSCTGIIISPCNFNNICDGNEGAGTCPADCKDSVIGVAKACAVGEKCASGSWCNNGKQCYYPDSSLTCLSWGTMGDNSCSKLAPGTKECSPTDTNCIEPGETGSINGWCKQGMECFASDGLKKFCQPYSYSGYGSGSNSCPAGYKICGPNDKTCIEPGSTGSLSGWCKNSMECFTSDGTQKFCQPYSNDPGKMTSCPAGSKLCGSNDPNCIEPGSAGSVTGWCKNSQECFSKDGTKKYCNPWPATMSTMTGNLACPAEYPKECRPDDKNCVEVGESSKTPGAWCAPGGKQCYLGDGALFCADEADGCPKDSKKCPIYGNPVAYSPSFTMSQCIEDEGPVDGWCGGSSTIQCYNKNGKTKKCVDVNSYKDPQAWENVSCPTGYDRCAPGSVGCLGYLGAKGKSGDWCAVGMTKYSDDGTVTCVSGKDFYPDPTPGPKPIPVPEPLPICINGSANVTAYDSATMNCKLFANSCNVPEKWFIVTDGRICKDGKLVNIETIGDDDVSMKKILLEKKKYLGDLEFRLAALPAFASGKEAVLSLIYDAQGTIKALYKYFPIKSEADRKLLVDKINNLVKDTIPTIENKMNSLKVYVNYNTLNGEIRRDLGRYRMILSETDSGDEYYVKLKEGIVRLESLLKTAETATGDVLEQLMKVIQTQWKDLQALEDGQFDDRGDDFMTDTIADLNESFQRFEATIVERDIDMPFILNHMDKLRALIIEIRDVDVEGGVDDEDIQKVNEAVKLKDKLALWLDERPRQDLVTIDNLTDIIDRKVAEAVDRIISKFENKLQLMMDEQIKKATAKFAELAEKSADRFSQKFAEQVAQNLNNFTAVSGEQKETLAADATKIMDRTEALIASTDNSDLSSFAKDSLFATMEKVASNVWCGDYAQKVQSELSSKGLAMEAQRLDAVQVAEFDKEVNEWIIENQRECYEVGATPAMDVPTGAWYHPYTMYSFNRGYMRGYGGDQAGNFGPGNATLRIEALAMIMRLLDIPEGDTAALGAEVARVAGVPEWGIGYVNGAKDFLDQSWNMAQPITRAETARLFVAAMTAQVKSYIDLPTVIDNATRYIDYAKFAGDEDTAVAVEALTDAGIFEGAGDGGFHPYDPLLRSEFATTIQRVDQTFVAGQEGAE